MLIGYARVSTFDQNIDLQEDALKKAGCERIFSDKISGSKKDRPGLNEAISHLRKGDTLVLWKLDRLGRSLRNLMDITSKLEAAKKLLSEGIPPKDVAKNLSVSIPTLYRWCPARKMELVP